jgi:hypothetical protein
MKTLIFLFLCTSLMAHADEQFIEDSGLQIKTGYGNTSKHYFSYDQEDLGRSYRFKKRRCYAGKVNRFKATFNRLSKKGFTYTSTETYINDLANGNGQIATFLVTYVKDTYEGNWIEDETNEATSGETVGRPADYLVYRYVHFECELKEQTQIHSKGRVGGKKLKKETIVIPKAGKSKSK